MEGVYCRIPTVILPLAARARNGDGPTDMKKPVDAVFQFRGSQGSRGVPALLDFQRGRVGIDVTATYLDIVFWNCT